MILPKIVKRLDGRVKFLAAIRRAVHHILTTQQHAAKQRSQNLRHINKHFTATRFKCQK